MKAESKPRPPSNLRVLMLSWEFPPRIVGGLARHVGELSLAMAKQGVEVDVLTAHVHGIPQTEQLWPQKGSRQPGRLSVHRNLPEAIHPVDFVSSIHQLNFGLLQQYLALPRSFDIIHGHDWLVAQASWTLKHGTGAPLIGTIHATEHGRQNGIHTPLQSYINANEWLLTYESARAICCSQYMANEVAQVHATPREKLRVIPNGIDPTRLQVPAEEKAGLADFRRRWAAPEEKIVLFVGRMVREKGAQILIDAAPRVLAGWRNTRFIIVGGGWTGHLASQAAARGVAHRVNFAGFVSEADLCRLYAVADVAVFPSLYEPFGIVALEAMAAGVPVITSDIGGFREVVKTGVTGLHTWANNADSLAWGILEVLRKPEEAAQRARNARREVKLRFSWESVAEQTLGIYRDALSTPPRKQGSAST